MACKLRIFSLLSVGDAAEWVTKPAQGENGLRRRPRVLIAAGTGADRAAKVNPVPYGVADSERIMNCRQLVGR